MNLKTLASETHIFDNAVKVWMLPFQSLKCDAQIDALQRIAPQFVWTHKDTGETTNDEPEAWAAAAKQAEAFQTGVQSDWKRERLWTVIHDTFALVEPLLIDAEVNGAKRVPKAALALVEYVRNRTDSVSDNWRLFHELMSVAALNELWQAFNATRDGAMDAPEDTADPNGEGGSA